MYETYYTQRVTYKRHRINQFPWLNQQTETTLKGWVIMEMNEEAISC